MTFREYLRERYRPATINTYLRNTKYYLNVKGKSYADKATYTQVVRTLGLLRKRYPDANTLSGILTAVKQYYQYLLVTGKRKDHPCKTLHLRDHKPKALQLQDLFTTKELLSLFKRTEYYKNMDLRNQVLLSLLIFQALSTAELKALNVEDVDLERGTIHIKGTTKTNARTLSLKSRQILLFYRYLNEQRPVLARKQKQTTGRLLLTWKGTPENGEGVSYLVEQYKHLFPGRVLNPVKIRQSVIVNLLKQGRDIRQVQAFAGHKYATTTEKYRPGPESGFKELLERYHPLGKNRN